LEGPWPPARPGSVYVRAVYKHIRSAQIEQNKLCIYYFRPYPVQKMVYLKVIQKITTMDVSVSENIGQKTCLKKFRGASDPLAPTWIRLWRVYLGDCYLSQTINNRVSGMLYQ